MDKGKALEYGRPAELLEKDAGAFTGAVPTAIYWLSCVFCLGAVVAMYIYLLVEGRLSSALHAPVHSLICQGLEAALMLLM
jgi:hypothetical protein